MMKDYYRQKRDIRALYSMRQRELDDIGISIDDIAQLEYENSFFVRLGNYFRSKPFNFHIRKNKQVDVV